MRTRTLLLLCVAILLAGGTAVLSRAWLAAQREAATAEASPLALPTPARSVLIARTGIQRGQLLKPDDLIWQPWPEGGLDKAYILIGTKSPESFTGWVARNPLAAGEPITESKIVAPGSRGYLAAVLRPGMRAISVPVTVTTGISGFIFPGDGVDLVITFGVPAVDSVSSGSADDRNTKYEHKAAETVLRDVRVIAIDQRLETKPGEPVVAKTATFEVTPKQSEIIALASEIGKLSLSLRSLVPTESEAAVRDAAATDSFAKDAPATFTLDSEISPLLPKPLAVRDNRIHAGVTILRGSARGGDSSASQPQSRGM